MDSDIKLIRPYISYKEVSKDIQEIFDSGQMTKGKHAKKFVISLKEYTKSNYAFLTTSATTALTMALKAIGIKAGDKVAVSDYSWPATSNVIEDLGAIPIFIDVNKETFNMDPLKLESKLDKTFSGVIVVDALGNPSGINKIKDICKNYNIPLIQDSACAIGSSVGDNKVGSIADITCFSFHPRKLISTGEGGAILTNDEKYAEWFDIKLAAGAKGKKGVGLDFVDYGYNYRLSEIQSLMGWTQLLKIDEITKERNIIAEKYCSILEPIGFKKQKVNLDTLHNIQSLVFKVPSKIQRDDLIDYLASSKIESTLGTYCLSGTSYYLKKYNDLQKNSFWLEKNTITLPCYKDVDVKRVTNEVYNFIKKKDSKS